MTGQKTCLLVGSVEACSGKSSTILGLAHQLTDRGISVGYGKPLGNYVRQTAAAPIEEDLQFVASSLNLSADRVGAPLIYQTPEAIAAALRQEPVCDTEADLRSYVERIVGEAILLELPPNLTEGRLFGLSAVEIARVLAAKVLLVVRYQSLLFVEQLIAAQSELGDCLLGVAVCDIPEADLATVKTQVKPFLEDRGIPVLGLLPRQSLLDSVSVRAIAKQLDARVLCCQDRLDFLVEDLAIGAMNVNSALEYFRKGRNLAIVTGSGRSDLQLAALETSAHCLILTGRVPPLDFVLSRAENLEIPILAVDLDTLSTVKKVERVFTQSRIQEPIQADCVRQLMDEHFDLDRLLQLLNLEPALSA
ncbi:MAG: phosphotransacetylase family protein [Cyanobacteria bacterium J06641_5]